MRTCIFIVILSLLISLPSHTFADCSYAADIDIEIEALDNRQLSHYQFPSFRESDYLALKNLRITNIGNCTLEEPKFIFQLKNDKTIIDNPFCIVYKYHVPTNITPNDYYEINRIPVENQTNRYVNSQDDEEFYCFIELDTLGRWEITVKPDIESLRPTNITSWSFKANGIFLNEVGFRVYDNLELSLLDLTKQSNSLSILTVILSIVAVIIAILAIIVTCWLQYKDHKFQKDRHSYNQKNILRSLLGEIKAVKEDIQGYKDEFTMTPKSIPHYEIKLIDANFYSKNLDSKINETETINLKKRLFKVYDKTNLINYYLKWLNEQNFNPQYHTIINMETGETAAERIINTIYPRMEKIVLELESLVEEASKILIEDFKTKE